MCRRNKATDVNESVPPRLSLQELVRRAAEVTTIGLATTYVIGFLIVNTYLMSYGYSGAMLFKTRHISAGALFIFLVAILSLYSYCIFWATQPIPNTEPITEQQRWMTILFATGGALVFLITILANIGGPEMRVN